MKPIILILTLLLTSVYAFCCDCKPLQSVSDSYKQSTHILKVSVIRSDLNYNLGQSRNYLDSISEKDQRTYWESVVLNQYILEVQEVYKGTASIDTIVLRTGLDPVTDCGLLLEQGDCYILYAQEVTKGSKYFDNVNSQLTLTSSSCTRTEKYRRKEERAIKKTAANNG